MAEKTREQYAQELLEMYRRRGGETRPEAPLPAPEAPPAAMTGEGRVIVVVTSGMGNIPIKGATVTVRASGDPDGTILRTATDESGKTGFLSLPAPAGRLSMAPLSGPEAVFALYDIEAEAHNYVTGIVRNVPVFDGVVSIQSMPLLWVPAAGGVSSTQTDHQRDPYQL